MCRKSDMSKSAAGTRPRVATLPRSIPLGDAGQWSSDNVSWPRPVPRQAVDAHRVFLCLQTGEARLVSCAGPVLSREWPGCGRLAGMEGAGP